MKPRGDRRGEKKTLERKGGRKRREEGDGIVLGFSRVLVQGGGGKNQGRKKRKGEPLANTGLIEE